MASKTDRKLSSNELLTLACLVYGQMSGTDLEIMRNEAITKYGSADAAVAGLAKEYRERTGGDPLLACQ